MKSLSVFISIFFILSIISTKADDRKYVIYDTKTGQAVTTAQVALGSLKGDVIFFGEFHDDTIIHNVQREVLSEMYKSRKKIAVSMEMFERDAQLSLDEYLNDKIKEDEFLKNSHPWPDYSIFYKPLVEMAKENKAPVIAANVPRKYAAIYSSEGMTGIEKLPADERKMIAAKVNVIEDDYQKNFYQVMLANMGMKEDYKPTPNQENLLYLYYGAQVVKDETMGESIANFIREHPDWKVIHFNGDFHSDNYLGTPQKVAARNGSLKMIVISPEYIDKGKPLDFNQEWKEKGDYVIAVENKPQMPNMQMMMGGHLAANSISKHVLSLDIDPAKKFIKGKDELTFKSPILKKGSISILKDLKVLKVESKGKTLDYKMVEDSINRELIFDAKDKDLLNITLFYEGTIYHKPNETQLNQKHAFCLGMISAEKDEGVYLPGGSFYFTTDEDLSEFDVTINIPKEFKVITSGRSESQDFTPELTRYHFTSEIPFDELTIIAGRFNIIDSVIDGKKFAVYTINSGSTAKAYLNAVIDYYKTYTKLLGPYPFDEFSVVENFFATGFGMPGYTLLSNKLMIMPWITLTPGSLAHEFVHNWWGNSVFIDHNAGNWCEALTTFCSNFYLNVYQNKTPEALDWRKKALLSLESLPEKSNYPLSKFKFQNNVDDAAIGYSKGGFLFYEIYKAIGDDRFFRALRNFSQKYKGKRATWYKIADAFTEVCKQDSINVPVRKIFNQLLMDSKIPTLTLKDVKFEKDTLSFNIAEDMMNWSIVPVRIITDKDTIMKDCKITGGSNRFNFKIDGKVKSVTVDPYYQVIRKLNKWEIPYSFSLTINENPLIILPSKKSKDYPATEQLVKMMKESDYKFDSKDIDDLKDEDWKDRTIIVCGSKETNTFFNNIKEIYPETIAIGNDNITIKGQKSDISGNIMLLNTMHPKAKPDERKSMSIIYYKNIQQAEQFRRLFRYMSYSMVYISASKMGRPMNQMEIFPPVTDKGKLEYLFNN